MIIKMDMSLSDFKPWCGACETFEIIMEHDLIDELEDILTELYPNGMTTTELNDLLWFEDEMVFEWLGIEI